MQISLRIKLFISIRLCCHYCKIQKWSLGKFTSNFGCVYPHFHKINIYGTKQTFESTALQTTLYKKRDKKIVKFEI